MTNEQREAIELLEGIRDNTWTTKYIMSSDSKKADTVLSLVKEQQAEIERLKTDNSNAWQLNAKMSTRHLNDIFKLQKKDKQIDLMAKAFKQDDARTVEEIKQYFERRVEDVKN